MRIATLAKALRCCQQETVFCENLTYYPWKLLEKSSSLDFPSCMTFGGGDKSTTTCLVNPLVERKLVGREKSETDGRAINPDFAAGWFPGGLDWFWCLIQRESRCDMRLAKALSACIPGGLGIEEPLPKRKCAGACQWEWPVVFIGIHLWLGALFWLWTWNQGEGCAVAGFERNAWPRLYLW